MSKAYDRVTYDILLKKLQGIGIRGVVYNWFVSYLQNRTQHVEIDHYNYHTGNINTVKSQTIVSKRSIPQGSVLGCILFLIYINDLPKNIDDHCTLFADDISIVIPSKTGLNLNKHLDITLQKIVDWLEEHNLQINFKKTKLIQFHPYQKLPLMINYFFHNTQIESVNNYPLLGINIDTNLNWKTHINKVVTKLSRFTYALYELKKTTDVKTATCAYFAYAHSWLQYGIILWGNSTDALKLFILQKRCLRIIHNLDIIESCKPYFVSENILTLFGIYILEICIFVRKNFHFFNEYSRPQNLRPHKKLAVPFSKLQIFHSGTHAMSIKIYNNIPTDIKDEPNFIKFKKRLKSYLIKKSFYTLQEFFEI